MLAQTVNSYEIPPVLQREKIQVIAAHLYSTCPRPVFQFLLFELMNWSLLKPS